MTFVKFVSLLDAQALYFTRADRLGDRFEGSMSRANLKARDAHDPRAIDAGRPELLRSWEGLRRWMPLQTFVNCWTLSGYESVAMWRLYVGDGNGVAIQSTFRRLGEAMRSEARPIFIGKVKYIDYDRDFVPEENAMYPFIRKRRSFEYEKEVRALTSTLFDARSPNPQERDDYEEPGHVGPIRKATVPISLPGLVVPVDLERLIVLARVSPVSPSWFAELVESVTRHYGFKFRVAQSDIDGEPVY